MSEKLISVEEACSRILAGVTPLSTEEIALPLSAGRVLAKAITATRAQPPGAVSAMDGYAVIAADLAQTGAELDVVGSIGAGDDPKFKLTRGTASRIFTGALLPDGADAVIAQEDAQPLEGKRVRFNETAAPGKHVRRAGSDFNVGDTVLKPGRLLDGRDIALAAAMNAARISVRHRPRVAILATGNELVPLGSSMGRHQIVASTGPALAAALVKWGAEPIDLGIAPDEETEIAQKIAHGRNADLLVTLGGASVGDHDLVQKALQTLSFELGFWKIAMKPGKPLIFGRLDHLPVIGLPGNPVSSLICALIFIRPLIHAMLGRATETGEPDIELPSATGMLAQDLPANGQRLDFLRGRAENREGGPPLIHVSTRQDSNQLSVLAQASCLVPRTPFAPASKAGAPQRLIPLEGLF
ncbi:MAG: gephyrin-like molybdotransferase Glp [Alphaproteobacteria bacterium]